MDTIFDNAVRLLRSPYPDVRTIGQQIILALSKEGYSNASLCVYTYTGNDDYLKRAAQDGNEMAKCLLSARETGNMNLLTKLASLYVPTISAEAFYRMALHHEIAASTSKTYLLSCIQFDNTRTQIWKKKADDMLQLLQPDGDDSPPPLQPITPTMTSDNSPPPLQPIAPTAASSSSSDDTTKTATDLWCDHINSCAKNDLNMMEIFDSIFTDDSIPKPTTTSDALFVIEQIFHNEAFNNVQRCKRIYALILMASQAIKSRCTCVLMAVLGEGVYLEHGDESGYDLTFKEIRLSDRDSRTYYDCLTSCIDIGHDTHAYLVDVLSDFNDAFGDEYEHVHKAYMDIKYALVCDDDYSDTDDSEDY